MAALLRKRAFSFPAHPHSSHPATPKTGNTGAAAETRTCNPPLSNRPVVVLSAAVGFCSFVCMLSGCRFRPVVVLSVCCRKAGHVRLPFCLCAVGMQVTAGCRSVCCRRVLQFCLHVVWLPVSAGFSSVYCCRGAINVSGWPSEWWPCYEKGPFRSTPTHTQATLPHLRPETPAPPQLEPFCRRCWLGSHWLGL